MKEIHCDCGKLLAKICEDGTIRVWCKSCKKEVKLEAKSSGPKEKAYNKLCTSLQKHYLIFLKPLKPEILFG